MLPLDMLLPYIERMTRGRDRPLLEQALAEALLNFLEVKRVRLYKCRQTAEEMLAWVAVDAQPESSIVNDDGISTPENAFAVSEVPHIRELLEGRSPGDLPDDCILLPIVMDDSKWFGFIEIRGGVMDVPLLMIVGQLVAVFKNMMALLDYSETDKLTGLLNRKTFDDYLLRILTHIERGDAVQHEPQRRREVSEAMSHWLGVIDIDFFKRINDTYGHAIGDEVLLILAAQMRASFRSNDKLFRFGGEEFVVLLKPAAADDAHAAFERFRVAMENRVIPLVGHITVSIGYVKIQPTDQRTQVFDRADEALYWAKQHGRNRVANYESLVARGELQAKQKVGSIELF